MNTYGQPEIDADVCPYCGAGVGQACEEDCRTRGQARCQCCGAGFGEPCEDGCCGAGFACPCLEVANG